MALALPLFWDAVQLLVRATHRQQGVHRLAQLHQKTTALGSVLVMKRASDPSAPKKAAACIVSSLA